MAWKLLAYAVAAMDGDAHSWPPEDSTTAEHMLWRRMVAPHWTRFVQVLNSVPDGMTRTSSTELSHLGEALADELGSWLITLGFTVTDDAAGSGFCITDWSLLIDM